MYKKFFSCFLLSITCPLFGLTQGYNSPDFWKKYTQALAFDLKLEPLSIKKTNSHYRFWNIGQVIDIWKDNSNFIHGEITNYAKEYDEMNLGKRTFYSSRLPIEPENASDIYQLILRSGLTSIPTGDAIDGWGKNTGGFTNIVECIDSGEYSFKCYLSPGKQGPLKEAMTIQSFITTLDEALKLKRIYKSFSASIPFWCYTKGTPDVTCRKK
jgi:hypothetical protein